MIEPLHPELELYINKLELFDALQHPLVYSVPYSPIMNDYLNKCFMHKSAEVDKCKENGSWSSYIAWHERPYRLNAFVDICHKMTNKEYSESLKWIWTDSENIWQNLKAWTKLLKHEKNVKEYFMNENELNKFNSLPDKINVFRGCQKHNKKGLSWTLDLDKAKWFANRFKANGLILNGVCSKKDVIAYTNDRNEEELIVQKVNY